MSKKEKKPAPPLLPCQRTTFDFRGDQSLSPYCPTQNTILLLSKVAPCVWSPVKVLRDQREHVCPYLEGSTALLQSVIHHHECLLRSSERDALLLVVKMKLLLTFDLISVIAFLKNTVLTCMVWGTKGIQVSRLGWGILDCFLAVLGPVSDSTQFNKTHWLLRNISAIWWISELGLTKHLNIYCECDLYFPMSSNHPELGSIMIFLCGQRNTSLLTFHWSLLWLSELYIA